MPLVGQGHERLGKDLHGRRIHAELTLLGPLDAPACANDVPRIYQSLQIPACMEVLQQHF